MIEFYKPRPDEYEKYVSYYKQCMHLGSESSFIALWSYQDEIDLERGFYEELFWHRARFKNGRNKNKQVWLPPIGDWDRNNWVTLFAEAVPVGTVFDHIPVYLKKIWCGQMGESLEITEMRDQWDYLYDIDRHIKQQGSAYIEARRDCRRFQRDYNSEYSLISPDDLPEIKAFQLRWMESNRNLDKPQAELEEENRTIMRILEHWSDFGCLFGAKLRVDGEIVAYVVVEELDDYIVSGHILKGDYSYKGIYKAMTQMFYVNTLAEKYSLINAWDDGGLDNLRSSKIRSNPMAFIKKYSIRYKPRV